MEINKNELLSRLEEMTDDELKGVIRSMAALCGANEKKTEQALRDVGKIRKSVEKLSDKDIGRMAEKLDDDQLDELKRQLGDLGDQRK